MTKTIIICITILLSIAGAYFVYHDYTDLKKSEYDHDTKTDSLLTELGKYLQHEADTENQARPIETRYITQKTVYRNITEKVKGLRADEKVRANHEYIKKFKGVEEVPERVTEF